VLVPIRYPLERQGVRTLERAIELAERLEDAHLWRQILTDRLDIDTDLEAFLRQHLDAELVV